MLTPEQELIMQGKVCPYCKGPSELVSSAEIYGRDYGPIHLCRPCNAYVGVHPGTTDALGRLANAELRKLKKRAHELFDKIWRLKYMKRGKAYKWLSDQLGLPKEYTHIGMFNEATCQKVIEVSQQYLNNKP